MSGIIQDDRTVTTNELGRIPAHLDVSIHSLHTDAHTHM